MLASECICLSPSICLHLSCRAVTSLGRMLASLRICLSPSMRLHSGRVLPDRQTACAPVGAVTCLPVCAFLCLAVLPDRWAACVPVRAFNWGLMLASVRIYLSPMLLVGAYVCSPSAHENVHCWRRGVPTVGAQECSFLARKFVHRRCKSVPRWRISVFTVGA